MFANQALFTAPSEKEYSACSKLISSGRHRTWKVQQAACKQLVDLWEIVRSSQAWPEDRKCVYSSEQAGQLMHSLVGLLSGWKNGGDKEKDGSKAKDREPPDPKDVVQKNLARLGLETKHSAPLNTQGKSWTSSSNSSNNKQPCKGKAKVRPQLVFQWASSSHTLQFSGWNTPHESSHMCFYNLSWPLTFSNLRFEYLVCTVRANLPKLIVQNHIGLYKITLEQCYHFEREWQYTRPDIVLIKSFFANLLATLEHWEYFSPWPISQSWWRWLESIQAREPVLN